MLSVEETTADRTSQRIGQFELLEQVGVGRFGSVWKARDTELDRVVAIKLPRHESVDPQQIDQFFREARAVAQLQHPSIVNVHEVGRDDGSLFIISDYIDGVSLSEWARDRVLKPRECAALAAKLAAALHHAHQRGVIHRDLKPTNILIDGQGEPHVVDFGLAKRDSGELTVTIDGKLLGTPAYMSPEQARGDAHSADCRSDVYSIGVILYELLVGRRPFHGEKRMLLMQIQKDEPVSPRRVNPSIPRDLETICLKCLEKEPARRYQTAGELRDDLDSFLQDKPIHARRVGAVGKTARWTRRNPTVAGLLATVMLALLATTIVSLLFAQHAARNAQQAREQEQQVTDGLYDALVREMQLTRSLREQGYYENVRQLVADARALNAPGADLADLRHELVAAMGDFVGSPPTTFEGHEADITALCLSSTGELLFTGHADGSVTIRPFAQTEDRLTLSALSSTVRFIAAENEDRSLLVAGDEGHIRRLINDGDTWRLDEAIRIDEAANVIAVESTAKRVAAVNGQKLKVWNVDTATAETTLQLAPEWQFRGAAFYSGRNYLVTSQLRSTGTGAGWTVWDLDEEKIVHQVELPTLGDTYINSIALSHDDKLLAIGLDGGLLTYEMDDFRQLSLQRLDATKAVAFSHSGSLLATVSIRGRVAIWNTRTNQLVAELYNYRNRTSQESIVFSRDDRQLASSHADASRVWQLTTAPVRLSLAGHVGGVPATDFKSTSDTLASGGKDAVVRIWDVDSGRLVREVPLTEPIQALDWSADDSLLAVGCWGPDGAQHLRILDGQSYNVLHEVSPEIEHVHDLEFLDYQGRRLLTATGEAGWCLWEVERQPAEKTLSVKRLALVKVPRALAVAANDEGKFIAFVKKDYAVAAWDVQKGEEVPLSAPKMNQGWHGLAFLPDSDVLMFVTSEGAVVAWSVSRNVQALPPMGEAGTFRSPHLAVQRRGKWLAALTKPNTVALWAVSSREHLFSFRPEQGSVHSLAWNSSGERVAVGRSDGSLAVWNIQQIRAKLAAEGLDIEDE